MKPVNSSDDENATNTPEPGLFRTLLRIPKGPSGLLPPRRRTAPRAVTTSDLTRFRGVLAASAVGAVVAVVAALVSSPQGTLSSPGPLARPHAKAGLACTSCHVDDAPMEAAAKQCKSCHGGHVSARPGHARLAREGALGCPTCHTIHAGDQGVFFGPDGTVVRFAPGIEEPLAPVALRPSTPTAVPLVTVASCTGCHDKTRVDDPIARCLVPSQTALGDAQPIVCFDEHTVALPGGLVGDRGRDRGTVCGAQHAPDRALAWEAARDVAVRVPVVGAAAASSAPVGWLGAALAAAALVLLGIRGADAWGRARWGRARATPTSPAPVVRARLPVIDAARCLGCNACVDACPYDVLTVERYVAVVARPDACCGLTLCETVCPNGSLRVTEGELLADRPQLSDQLESRDVPGLFLAGDVTGLSLIKNALRQGAQIIDHIASLGSSSRDSKQLDVLIVGGGPAGLAAALRAKEKGLSYELIEQATVAQAIRSFPRDKLVFDQPLDMPVVGALWLKESSKEELLAHWERILRREKPRVVEGVRMTGLAAQKGGGFVVSSITTETERNEERRARFVVLAVGRRGTPRRLPVEVPLAAENKVFYGLADAATFAGKRVVVAGLGDVAMEAAIALAHQKDTQVTVVARADDFRRGSFRNIEEVRRLAREGLIDLRFQRAVTRVTASSLTLDGPEGSETLGFDALFVMIGAIPPWDLLRAAGVRAVAEAPLTSA